MKGKVAVVWLLFVVRGVFCAAMLPLWEGWDEYGHFSRLSSPGMPSAFDLVTREVDESMRLAPLARELRWIGAPYLTHDDWWKLPEAERNARRDAIARIPPSYAGTPARMLPGKQPLGMYEAQQPPLFYWIAGPVARAAADWPLRSRVFLLRLFCVLIASTCVPFAWLTCINLLGDRAAALASAALIAIAPVFAIEAAHVSNDCLAIAVTALFLWQMSNKKSHWFFMGLTLTAAILTKASLLILIPVWIIRGLKRPPPEPGASILFAISIGGWWYLRNAWLGLPITGWQESMPFNALVASAKDLLRTGKWLRGAQTVAKSFTWFGAWSFMTLRTWMYAALELTGLAGVLAGIAFGRERVAAPTVLVSLFAVAIAVGEVAYNAAHGIAGLPGWYLWPAGTALAILVAAGLGAGAYVFVAMLAAADIFGMVGRMLPYYSGLAEWNHGSVFSVFQALNRMQVSVILFLLWLAATIVLPFYCLPAKSKASP